MTTSTANLLIADDSCRRREFLERSWERSVMNPMNALYRSIGDGLESEADDPGQYAGDTLMGLAVSRGLDTSQSDLLGHAEHLAAIADMVTWLLRTGDQWECPADKDGWVSSAYLNASGSRLRRVVLVDRWSEERAVAEEHSWRTLGETAVYRMPMDLIIVALGQNRDGRRHGPISKGYLHPQNHNLRFLKRDGEPFGPSWERVFREESNIGREEWLEEMTEDGVLAECVLTHEVPVPEYAAEIREIIKRKLERIEQTKELPEPQFSQCDDPISPCQFSSCCPHFRQPTERGGFLHRGPDRLG